MFSLHACMTHTLRVRTHPLHAQRPEDVSATRGGCAGAVTRADDVGRAYMR